MSIIKQLATYDGSAWTTDDIGANASNVSLTTNVAGQTNVQSALSKIVGTSALTADRAVITGTGGVLSTSTVTNTELSYLSGTTSNIQTQIDTLNNNLNSHFNLGQESLDGTAYNDQLNILTDALDLSKSDNGISNYTTGLYQSLIFRDKENRISGAFQVNSSSNGNVQSQFYVRNYDTNGTVLSDDNPEIALIIDKNNNRKANIFNCDKIQFNGASIIKIVNFGWQFSGAFSAGNKIGTISPSNSLNPESVPSGYTFVCWINLVSQGWVGGVYAAAPYMQQSDIYTTSAKGTTTGRSLNGLALYIKSECL